MQVLLITVVLLVVLLVIRAFWLWYWKVNVIIERLDAITAALKKVHQVEVVTRSESGGQVLWYPKG